MLIRVCYVPVGSQRSLFATVHLHIQWSEAVRIKTAGNHLAIPQIAIEVVLLNGLGKE